MPPTRDKVVATFRRGGVEDAVVLRDGRLPKMWTSACNGESVDRHRFLLNQHHELETIGEQPANHSPYAASLVAFRKTSGNGVGGRPGLDVVRLVPAREAGKTRRRIERHV